MGDDRTTTNTSTMGQQDIGGIVDPKPGEGQTANQAIEEGKAITGTFSSNVTLPEILSDKEREFYKIVGDEYKEKTFVKEIAKKENPTLELVKMLDNSQSMIGKQSAEIKNLQTGSTAQTYKPEDFQIAQFDWGKDDADYGKQIEANRNPELMDAMKQTAVKAGLSPKQFNDVIEGFEKTVLKISKVQVAKHQAEAAKYDAQFDEQMTKKFGASVGQVKEVGRGLISALADDEEKAAFRTFSNEQAVALASFLRKLSGKYIQADGFTAAAPAMQSDQQKEILELMAKPPYSNNDFQHPDYNDVVARVNNFFGTNQKKK